MNFVFDGIILAVAIVAIVVSARRGFIKSIMGICTLIAALFVAFAFTPNVAQYIETSPVITEVSENISDTLKSLSRKDTDSYDLARLFTDMPDSFQQILNRYGASAADLKKAIAPEADAAEKDVVDLSERIAKPVVSAISGVLAFLGLFIVSVAVLKLLTWLLDLIFQLPVLKTANTLLGFVVGVFNALVWAWVLSALSVIFIRAMSSISPTYFSETLIANTIILRFFADDNFGNILRMVIG